MAFEDILSPRWDKQMTYRLSLTVDDMSEEAPTMDDTSEEAPTSHTTRLSSIGDAWRRLTSPQFLGS